MRKTSRSRTTTKSAGVRTPTHRISTHPGEILKEEFLDPHGLSINRAASLMRVTADRVSKITRQERSITADTAMRLSRLLGTTAEFWLNLQMAYDLSKARQEIYKKVEREVIPLAEDVA